LRTVHENGSAVPVSIQQPNLTAIKINAELPLEGILPQFPLIEQDLTFSFQLPSQVLNNYVPYGKIIQSPFSTQLLEMLPEFPDPNPGIVFLSAGSIFPNALGSYFLKFVHENPEVIPYECFQRARFIKIKACLERYSVVGWWHWHFYSFIRGGFDRR
jgi:hypothetical protein